MLRFFKYLVLTVVFSGLLAAAAGVGGLYYLVVKTPCPEMDESAIESILGQESPVYYRDGQHKLGVLFKDIHRQYVRFDQIPKNFVNAIVAAEDKKFFTHYGVDLPGIARAMIANYKAGHVVQGGSTITQQTAKNLFKRESRSYRAKLKELLYALRLENKFSKEKILEFYANQFYVSGNGHGLGVAARYYFDKDVADLTLLEASFIAGSVKRPNYYNPFTKKNRKDARKALIRADERAAYVLGNMLKQGMISKKEYQQAIESDIVFKQGKTSFALNTTMDLVRDGLATQVISRALEEHGISNISTSGARIISSVDYDLQAKTFYSLRRELSRLDVRLRGYNRKEVQAEYAKNKSKGDGEIKEKCFLFGTITEITQPKSKSTNGQPVITVHFGPKQPEGYIDAKGLERMAQALIKYKKGRNAKSGRKALADLLSRLKVGDRVYVSVREVDLFDGAPTLDLERYPKLQGAALVMQQGLIRAMVGGMENRFYNRAVSAKRLMGSTFKPFVFSAALQLGWNSVDLLDNRRNVFVFMGRPYFPRPDHHSPFDFVSMSWAGVKSENVAAVWLLYHLTDNLTLPQLQALAGHLHMDRENGENYQSFKERIRDKYGIRVTRSTLERAAYDRAVVNLETDFLFDDRAADYQQLKHLPYGLNFDSFRADQVMALKNRKLKNRQRVELRLRASLLGRNFLVLQSVQKAMFKYRDYLYSQMRLEMAPLDYFDSQTVARPEGGFYLDENEKIIFLRSGKKHIPDTWQLLDEYELRRRLEGLLPGEADMFWENIVLNGLVSSYAVSQVQQQMQEERAALTGRKPYSFEVLSSVRDYKIMLGLQYLIKLGREAGLTSTLQPVLSFPLGSNVVSLAETVRMYETMVTGNRYDVLLPEGIEKEGTNTIDQDGLSIIERIEGPDGDVIYGREADVHPVYDPGTSTAVSNILENIIRYGTGTYARKNVRLHSEDKSREKELARLNLPLPLLGKTGTANDYRNASFMGYVPTGIAPEGAALTFHPGYTVGVYVGFDSNLSMKKGNTHITGAQGALHAWSSIARALYDMEKTGDKLDTVDLVFNGVALKYPDTHQIFVPADPKNGGLVLEGKGGSKSLLSPAGPAILSHGRVNGAGVFEPQSRFMPFWVNQK